MYNGEEPFSSFLKKYFSANKKFGSKDRKAISHSCYCYFRLGKAAKNLPIEERILVGLFMCSNEANEMLAAIKPEWNEKVLLPVSEKCSMFNVQCSILNVFPWKDELSEGIDQEKLCESFFVQPDVFVRVRPGKREVILKKLQIADCRFEILNENCISFANAIKLEDILDIDEEVVIQDYNSQQAGHFFKSKISDLKSKIRVWDCCAGSGGKSIMAYDIDPNIELTVSDIRESILANLKKRFQRAHITNYKSFVVDLSSNKPKIPNLKSKIIVCDAPCTGSGTWSRTPEQLYFFDEKKIEEYSKLQKEIVSNAIPLLQPGGAFIYITCSVFKKENEEVVEFIKQKFQLQVKRMEVLKGYDKKADSMFVAVFEKL